VAGSRASRLTAVISGGTIPDRGLYTVNLADRTRLGELDEEFVHESRVGDVFQLGSATWRIGAIEHDRVIVTPAPGRPARMPFWHGEFLTRSVELSRRVGQLRRELASDALSDEALETTYRCDAGSIKSLRSYVQAQRAATGVVPDDRTLVIEHFRDELGGIRIIVHSIFGGRVNAPWGMALAHRVRELLGGTVDLQVQTSDDGIMLRLPDLGRLPPIHALLDLTAAEVERRIVEEVGGSPLFGARFRMNAARALLLPRGSPRRRMPLWLQRLKALDLLDVVREFPSFPILVETYREVLQDAFDLPAVSDIVHSVAEQQIAVHVVETDRPSPFASGLQLGFVMDWLYTDDTPRAERAAARLALDREMLDALMGVDGVGIDEATERALSEVVARRQGTANGRQARDADELAMLLDRAGDLTPAELRARVAPSETWRGGRDPAELLMASGRAVDWAGSPPDRAERIVPLELRPRYDAAHAGDRIARREILARHLGTAGPVTIAELVSRYGWPADWIEARLGEWQRAGKIVKGRYRRGIGDAEWCARGTLERARRRALAALRAEIRAVDRATFMAFLARWQHIDPRDRLTGEAGVAAAVEQLAGLARPAIGWERDYLPARLERYEGAWLSQLTSGGSIVWVASPRRDASAETPSTVSAVRFFERGAGALWLDSAEAPSLSGTAVAVRDALVRQGASFLADIQTATGLGALATRDAIRELVAAGLVTNDTIEALRAVMHERAMPVHRQDEPDPTRWLPSDFTPSTGRIVQRRVNATRLPRWRRPDRPAPTGNGGWIGRWSLVSRPTAEGPPEDVQAAAIARSWLARYGVVARDWWRRERPPVSWRAIYHELKRLEFRGEVRRGYFVEGLGGAQFALPEAVEQLRAAREDPDAPFVAFAASDPANVYSLPRSPLEPAGEPDPLTRPRGSGAILVTRRGAVVLAAEGRGRRLRVATDADDDALMGALAALQTYLARGETRTPVRPRTLDTVDGAPAVRASRLAVFRRAGFRRGGMGLEWPEPGRSGLAGQPA
jgi:ATP-dependent Lhr-like helicase